jgi:flagellar basal body-associated protein FliL
MLVLIVVFAVVFAVLAAVGAAFAWAFQSRAEARVWRERHQEAVQRQNSAAWERNREMYMY